MQAVPSSKTGLRNFKAPTLQHAKPELVFSAEKSSVSSNKLFLYSRQMPGFRFRGLRRRSF